MFFLRLLIVVVCGIVAVRFYCVHAAEVEAAQFAPADNAPVVFPAGQPVEAILTDGIAAAAARGDSVTAFVSWAALSNGRLVIPSGSQFKGRLKEISISGRTAKVRIDFSILQVGDREFTIRTLPVVAVAPVETDIGILGEVFRTLMSASLGASIGASSEDLNAIQRGMAQGMVSSQEHLDSTSITVVLAEGLEI